MVLDDGNQYLYGAGLTAQKQSGNWYYYLADGLGSTMAVVNASGTVQDSYTYDVYGTPTKTGSLANEFDFAGQQTDGTGLQYLRARYYDPATGTFLSLRSAKHASQLARSPVQLHRRQPRKLKRPHRPVCLDSPCPDFGQAFQDALLAACYTNPILCAAIEEGTDDLKPKLLLACEVLGACVFGFTWEVDGVRFCNGKAGQKEAFKHYRDEMGQPEYVSCNRLHALKRKLRVGADEDFTFDENGNVYQTTTVSGTDSRGSTTKTKWYLWLGNITDTSVGSGLK